MPFFKIPLADSDDFEALYPFIIIEAGDDYAAYDLAVGEIPPCFGALNEDECEQLEEVNDPLTQPFPIFTSAMFEVIFSERMARAAAMRAKGE